MADLFFEIGLLIIVATLVAAIAKALRQPLILAYIIAGILIGPLVAGLIVNLELIRNISELGIAFLLFIVGMEIDMRRLRDVGGAVMATALVQVVLSFSAGFAAASLLGFSRTTAGYVGIALAFGSTMVVIKLLSDKRRLDTLHGRSVLGILLVQDIIAIIALTLLPSLSNPSLSMLELSLVKGMLLFAVAVISARLVLPRISRFLAASHELLFIGALGWLFLLAIFAQKLDYSIAIGAFLAGVTLGSSEYSAEITARIKPLRDFFATLFFVALGMQINFSYLANPAPIIVLVPIIVFFTPLVDIFMLSLFGYNKRAAFLTGSSLGQISEFSLIVIALGVKLGHVPESLFSLITIISVITITTTSYLIKYDERLYQLLSKPLSVFERLGRKREMIDYIPGKMEFEVLLCGHNRMGYSILKALRKMGKRTLVIDYNPDTIRMLARKKTACVYGDINNAELLDELHLGSIQLLISTVPEVGANRLLIQKVRKINKKAVIMATAERFKDALRLYAAGSDYVIMPHMIGGEHVSQLLRESKRDFASLKRRKQEHLAEIKAREQLGKTNIKMNIFNKGIINKEITKNKGLNKLINKGFTK